MTEDHQDHQDQTTPAAAQTRPVLPTGIGDPLQFIGAILDAMRNGCQCNPCAALRHMGGEVADRFLASPSGGRS